MKKIFLTLIVCFLAMVLNAQSSKIIQVYDKYLYIKGTEFTLASVESLPKIGKIRSNLLFINTMTGESKSIDFAEGMSFNLIQQVKIDSLEINMVLIVVSVSADNKKSLYLPFPKQIYICSPNGENMKQLTENNFNVYSFSVNEFTGTLIVSGYLDLNQNRKKNSNENNEILLFDLKTGALKHRIQ